MQVLEKKKEVTATNESPIVEVTPLVLAYEEL